MHYKYSTILTTCYVTFMYGFGLPYLFPVAILSMAVLYFTEKTMLYYCYRSPPMYDEKTYELVIKMLKGAPIFYCAFGYWMCSSNQLLSNDYIYPKELVTSTMKTGHIYTDVLTARGWSGPAWPLLVMFVAFLVNALLGWLIKDILDIFVEKYKLDLSRLEEREGKEENYFSILSEKDARWTVAEEKNCRNLGQAVPTILDESYYRLVRIVHRNE